MLGTRLFLARLLAAVTWLIPALTSDTTDDLQASTANHASSLLKAMGPNSLKDRYTHCTFLDGSAERTLPGTTSSL